MQGNRIFTTKFYILGNFKLALNLIDIMCKSTYIIHVLAYMQYMYSISVKI